MIRGLDHAALVVSDINRAIKFYREVLGLGLNYDGRRRGGNKLSFLGNEQGSFIALEEGRRGGAGGSLSHLAFGVDDVEQEYETLKSRGVDFVGERTDPGGKAKSYYFTDPDGLELEIYGPVKKRR